VLRNLSTYLKNSIKQCSRCQYFLIDARKAKWGSKSSMFWTRSEPEYFSLNYFKISLSQLRKIYLFNYPSIRNKRNLILGVGADGPYKHSCHCGSIYS
jgi:hypothetical protein